MKYCLDEQDWLLGENYKANNSKFTYSFVDDSKMKAPAPKSASNYLSITAMTDDAISRSSRDRSVKLSPTKSSRSAQDDDE